jgi:hypothetical protein
MRALKLVLTATGFATYFIGMIALSAATTSAVHSSFSPRPMPTNANFRLPAFAVALLMLR